jgi:hypothetical protein
VGSLRNTQSVECDALGVQVQGEPPVSSALQLHAPSHTSHISTHMFDLPPPSCRPSCARMCSTPTFPPSLPPCPQITTPDDLGAVNVEALLPGGLEPVDPNVTPGMCDQNSNTTVTSLPLDAGCTVQGHVEAHVHSRTC